MNNRIWNGVLILFVIICGNSCKQETNHSLKQVRETKIEKQDIPTEYMILEATYKDILEPISNMKLTEPKTYWFIVSWLGTNYNTPIWTGYGSTDWQEKTKERGIDCSGFARVMQEEIFGKKVRGGSQGILNNYCKPVLTKNLTMGDLLFFKAPGSKSNSIVHVGTFLFEGYFVHATSKKTAGKGLGLNISSLTEKRWANNIVTGGRIKE